MQAGLYNFFMIFLTSPDEKYEKSYLQALMEFSKEKYSLEYRCPKKDESFDDFKQRIAGMSQGFNLPDGFVPETILWLIDDHEYIGEVSVRHTLNYSLLRAGGHIGYVIRPSMRKKGYGKRILKLSLEVVKSLGMKKVLLTCDETNIGSVKIIESNGGVLEDATDMGQGLPRKLRYWIHVE